MTARRHDDLCEHRAQRAGRVDMLTGSDPHLRLEPAGQMAEFVHDRALLRDEQQQQKPDGLEQRFHSRRWRGGLQVTELLERTIAS